MFAGFELVIDIGLTRVVLDFLLNEGAGLRSSPWMLVEVCVGDLKCISAAIRRLAQPLKLIFDAIKLVFGLVHHYIWILLPVVILLLVWIICIDLRFSGRALSQLLLISLLFGSSGGGLDLFENINAREAGGETGLLLLNQFLLVLQPLIILL